VKLRLSVNPAKLSVEALSKRLKIVTAGVLLSTAVLSKKLTVQLGRFILIISKANTATASEDSTYRFHKKRVNTASVGEQRVMEYRKALNHTAAFSDGEQYFAEDYVVGAPFFQDYTEPLQLFKFVRKPFSNDAELSDVSVSQLVKTLVNGVGATDDINGVLPGDDQTFAFFKAIDQQFQAAEDFVRKVTYKRSFTDDFTSGDEDVVLFGKIVSDAGSLADDGSLRAQGYTEDMTYFAEDYVGTTRTF
jgi:hypothetical protein